MTDRFDLLIAVDWLNAHRFDAEIPLGPTASSSATRAAASRRSSSPRRARASSGCP